MERKQIASLQEFAESTGSAPAKEDLCELYGHENCTELEISADADLVFCCCVCHSEPEAHA